MENKAAACISHIHSLNKSFKAAKKVISMVLIWQRKLGLGGKIFMKGHKNRKEAAAMETQ